MNIKLVSVIVAVTIVTFNVKADKAIAPSTNAKLTSNEQRLSYMVFNQLAQQFIYDGVEVDLQAAQLGINDALNSVAPRLSDAEKQEVVVYFTKKNKQRQKLILGEHMQQRAKKRREVMAVSETNVSEGKIYLDANAKKEGVVVTPSGLQYKALITGQGTMLDDTDTVALLYRGTLLDGTEFDSAVDRDKPVTFSIKDMIPGLKEALNLMQVGDKWMLAIPTDLAYGPRTHGEKIGTNATLLYEIEVLDVIKPTVAKNTD